MRRLFLLQLCLFAHAFAVATELVATCNVGGNTGRRVDALRDSKIADTYVYYLRQDGTKRPFFGDRDSSRGSSVQVACVGSKARALVVTGEFTSNFLQGFVLSRNPKTGLVERLDFAEKNRPAWLYLSESETTVVIPAHAYGETTKKFVMYRHFVGSAAEPQVVAMDELPPQTGAEIIKLENDKSR